MFPQNRENLANVPFCILFLKSSECLFKYSKKLFKNLKIKLNFKEKQKSHLYYYFAESSFS